MSEPKVPVAKHSERGEAVTALVLDIFRLNARLLSAGDGLVAELGLTSARWQVLGALAAAERPQPVSHLARDMGGHRQNVQRIVNDLMKKGLVRFETNPHHRRAQLVVLTDAGRSAAEAARELQVGWVEDLAEGLDPDAIETTRRIVGTLRSRLQVDGDRSDED
ncbi:MarR family winged helix-turn-helix transcriptional regulator [Consotaella aegiceratis]|uniref:MarR family winged helix-turn-helix transcriptional regulator n=1 Tax=Consotaella aegiceratis TaxID=3097961 RepID=UPI002F3FA672